MHEHLHRDRPRGVELDAGGRYAVIVMPEVDVLPLAVARKLAEFEASGGRIVWMATLPTMGDAPDEHAAVSGMFAVRSVVALREVVSSIGTVVTPAQVPGILSVGPCSSLLIVEPQTARREPR